MANYTIQVDDRYYEIDDGNRELDFFVTEVLGKNEIVRTDAMEISTRQTIWNLVSKQQKREIENAYDDSLWANAKASPYTIAEGLLKNFGWLLYLNFIYNQRKYGEAQLIGSAQPAYGDAPLIQEIPLVNVIIGTILAVFPAVWTVPNQAGYVKLRADHPIPAFLIQHPKLLNANAASIVAPPAEKKWCAPGSLTPLIIATTIVNIGDGLIGTLLMTLGKAEGVSGRTYLIYLFAAFASLIKANADIMNIVKMVADSKSMKAHFLGVQKNSSTSIVQYAPAESKSSYIHWVKNSPIFQFIFVKCGLPALYGILHGGSIYNSYFLMRMLTQMVGTHAAVSAAAGDSAYYTNIRNILLVSGLVATVVKTLFYDLRKMGMTFGWVQERAEKISSADSKHSLLTKRVIAAYFSFAFLLTMTALFEYAASSATASTALSPAIFLNATYTGPSVKGFYSVDGWSASIALLGAISQMLQCWDAFGSMLGISKKGGTKVAKVAAESAIVSVENYKSLTGGPAAEVPDWDQAQGRRHGCCPCR